MRRLADQLDITAMSRYGYVPSKSELLDVMADRAYSEVEAAEAQARTGISDQQWWQTYGPLLADVLDPDRYPTAVRVGTAADAEYGAAHDPARSFRFGLRRVIDGIALFVGQAL